MLSANCCPGNSFRSHIKLIRFSGGGHFAFKKYAAIVNEALEGQLNSLDNLAAVDSYFQTDKVGSGQEAALNRAESEAAFGFNN